MGRVQGDPSGQPREEAEREVDGMERRALVLDANILIRAVPGQRVRRILEAHADNISFFVPESAYAEAEEHLAALVVNRGGDPAKGLASLEGMEALGTIVSQDLYADFESEARKRSAHAIPVSFADGFTLCLAARPLPAFLATSAKGT